MPELTSLTLRGPQSTNAGTPPGTKGSFEIKRALDAESAIAKILMAARDPDIDIPVGGARETLPQTLGVDRVVAPDNSQERRLQ
jgi:hypothetical protein